MSKQIGMMHPEYDVYQLRLQLLDIASGHPPYKELHPAAEALAQRHINDFATSLLQQAKTLAHQRKDDVVTSNHIKEALNIIHKEQKQSWWRELIIMIGSALFGAFIQGFITALLTEHVLLIAIYTLLGLVGMSLVFWGLRS
jgi:hypothetical protein